MEINIKEIENNKPSVALLDYMPRKIITEINKTRNIYLQQGNYYDKCVVGLDIILYLEDSNSFILTFSDNQELEYVGNLMGIKIYRDNTYKIKGNELFFFDDENQLPFRKSYQRMKKLERILKDEL